MLVWMDIETTGLDPQRDIMLEIAVVVTDDFLNEQGHFSSLIIDADPRRFVQCAVEGVDMREIYKGHFENGLVDELRAAFDPDAWEGTKAGTHSNYAYDVYEWGVRAVEKKLLSFLELFGIEAGAPMAGRPPLCGSTISFDRGFLQVYMPKVLNTLHYRNVDVSTVKLLAERWWPTLPTPEKQDKHRALDDIRDSINLLRFYREKEFICGA